MIVKNEIENLQRSLPQLRFCDEILLVDSGSTDGTREFAESMGARVLDRDFDGYGPQKAFAVNAARNDWVINLDADEFLPDALAREIADTVRSAVPGLSGIILRRRLVFLGEVFSFGRESRDEVLRVFRKSRGNFNQASVHEEVLLDSGVTIRARSPLEHRSYSSIAAYLEKMNRYTTLGAQEVRKKHPARSGFLWSLLFPVKFIQFYLLQLNFLNGWAGLSWSVLSATAFFIKYLKVATGD